MIMISLVDNISDDQGEDGDGDDMAVVVDANNNARCRTNRFGINCRAVLKI